MVQGKVDLYKVQWILGHKSPIMTQRYAHHYPESLRNGVEVLDVGRAVSTKSIVAFRICVASDPQLVRELRLLQQRFECMVQQGLGS